MRRVFNILKKKDTFYPHPIQPIPSARLKNPPYIVFLVSTAFWNIVFQILFSVLVYVKKNELSELRKYISGTY